MHNGAINTDAMGAFKMELDKYLAKNIAGMWGKSSQMRPTGFCFESACIDLMACKEGLILIDAAPTPCKWFLRVYLSSYTLF